MFLKMSALPVPGPCASRMMVPSSMFQSTSAPISTSSPCALSAAIQLRRSPNATGFRSIDIVVALGAHFGCYDLHCRSILQSEIVMRVVKWGGNLVVALPPDVVEELGLKE